MADGTKRTVPSVPVDPELENEEMVNDSLGTISIADSTGSDEEKETGDAKIGNKDTKQQD